MEPSEARSDAHSGSKSTGTVRSRHSEGAQSRLDNAVNKTAKVSSESPYLPTRSHGSSKRRAQRSTSGTNCADQPDSPQGDAMPANRYEPPSIEDATGSSPKNGASPSGRSFQGGDQNSWDDGLGETTTIRPDDSPQQGRTRIYSSSPLMDSSGRPLSTSERLRMNANPTGMWSASQSDEEQVCETEPHGSTQREFFDDPYGASSPPTFSRGAFSMDSGFKSHAWDWNKFRRADEEAGTAAGGNASRQSPPYCFDQGARDSSPTESQRTETPHQSFEENLGDEDYPSPPHFHHHPPRSAFSSFFDDAPKDYGARMSQGPPGSRSAPTSPSGQPSPETARNH